ncbi:BTB/POZ domain, partial [Trinorchestia longiramus]
MTEVKRVVTEENQTEHPIIFLRDVNFWELEAILDFIYNGQVNIMREQLPGFIRTAEALQIKGLAAVNNNNNPFNFNNNNINSINNNIIAAVNNNNSSNMLKYSHLPESKFGNGPLEPVALDTKYGIRPSSPATSPPDSPPATPNHKKRRHDSPQPP